MHRVYVFLTNVFNKSKVHTTPLSVPELVMISIRIFSLPLDIVPPKVRVKDFYESLKKQKGGAIEVNSSSDSE